MDSELASPALVASSSNHHGWVEEFDELVHFHVPRCVPHDFLALWLDFMVLLSALPAGKVACCDKEELSSNTCNCVQNRIRYVPQINLFPDGHLFIGQIHT